jgi:hypothetical protein
MTKNTNTHQPMSSDPARYAAYRAECKVPGKFEGCAPYIPYFWDTFLNGMADSDDGDVLTFQVDSDDRALFPELKGRRYVKLVETNDGFVCEV